MSNAVKYAGLVGKYVSLERLATPQEVAAGTPAKVALEGVMALVHDGTDGAVVFVVDYGYEFRINPGEDWIFHIWPDEETAQRFRRRGIC